MSRSDPGCQTGEERFHPYYPGTNCKVIAGCVAVGSALAAAGGTVGGSLAAAGASYNAVLSLNFGGGYCRGNLSAFGAEKQGESSPQYSLIFNKTGY